MSTSSGLDKTHPDPALGFAVVGMGHIGKRHAALIRQMEGARLVALCDVLPPESLGMPLEGIEWYSGIENLLENALGVDVVCVCTPNGLHATHAVQALRAHKHVVIEKPMALTLPDAQHIMDTAEAEGKQIFCVMQNRYSPASIWLKSLVANGVLGKIFLVEVNCYWNRDDRYYQSGAWRGTRSMDGGTIFTQYSHFIDILIWLFGEIRVEGARFQNFSHQHSIEFEDSGVVQFSLPEGGMGVFSYSTAVWDANLESSITLIGQQGAVKVGGQYMNEVLTCHIKDYEMPALPPASPPNDYGTYKGSAANHYFIFKNVLDVLTGKDQVHIPPQDGLKVVATIEEMYRQTQ